MKKTMNNVHLEGYVYDIDMKEAVTGERSKFPGTKYLRGTIQICTDEVGANVCPVYIPYATPVTPAGRANETYNILSKLMSGEYSTWMNGGKDNACRVRIDTSIGVNDFYATDGTLVSQVRNEGGFLHIMTEDFNDDTNQRASFQVDTVITNVIEKEADPEREMPAHALIKGYTFNYNASKIMPVDFMITKPDGIRFFLSIGASNAKPYFTKLSGHQTSRTAQIKVEEESAFGDPIVRFRSVSRKAYVVDSCLKQPYLWDDAETITAAEFKSKLADRDVELAALKQSSDEYRKNRAAGGTATATTAAAASTNALYDF